MEKPLFFNQSTFIVNGSSRCGKTVFVTKLLYNLKDMFVNGAPGRILYCYRTIQDSIVQLQKDIPGVILNEGLPSIDEIKEHTDKKIELLLVLDDLIHDVIQSKDMSNLFMTGRHLNMSIIFITQNMLEQGKFGRGINLNACYIILFRNIRDTQQVKYFARQIYPTKVDDFMKVYNDVMKKPFQYLVVDTHAMSDDAFRLRTNVFPNENMVIYKI